VNTGFHGTPAASTPPPLACAIVRSQSNRALRIRCHYITRRFRATTAGERVNNPIHRLEGDDLPTFDGEVKRQAQLGIIKVTSE
jgi:hypothetical protein